MIDNKTKKTRGFHLISRDLTHYAKICRATEDYNSIKKMQEKFNKEENFVGKSNY